MYKKIWAFLIVCVIGVWDGCALAAPDDSFGFMDTQYNDYTTDDNYDDYASGTDEFTDASNTDFMYAAPDDTPNEYNEDTENITLNNGASVINVAGFDIAGIMLGMSFDDVYNLYHDQNNLYSMRKKNSLVYTVPQDWKYNLDYECRQAGIVQPSKLDKCIRSLARNRGLLYVSEIHLERAKTGETIDVYLTSNATDNVVYRIVYTNDVDKLEGKNPKFADQRDKKILAFWKNVIKKYGAPNSGQDKWITSTNAYDPKMTAYYGALDLVDKGRQAMDAATAAQQSRDNFHAKPYAF